MSTQTETIPDHSHTMSKDQRESIRFWAPFVGQLVGFLVLGTAYWKTLELQTQASAERIKEISVEVSEIKRSTQDTREVVIRTQAQVEALIQQLRERR